jgi:hypothetical protein
MYTKNQKVRKHQFYNLNSNVLVLGCDNSKLCSFLKEKKYDAKYLKNSLEEERFD